MQEVNKQKHLILPTNVAIQFPFKPFNPTMEVGTLVMEEGNGTEKTSTGMKGRKEK